MDDQIVVWRTVAGLKPGAPVPMAHLACTSASPTVRFGSHV